MLIVLIVSIAFLSGSTAQFLRPGPCPKVTGVNYNLNRVTGLWYEYAATSDKYNNTLKCLTHDWFPPKNYVSTYLSSAVSKKTENVLQIESDCSVNKTDNSVNSVSHVPLVGDYLVHWWVFEILYDSYSISWSCQEQGSNHLQSSIIYTRDPYPSMNPIGRAKQIFARKGLPVFEYQKYDNNCYFK